MKVISLLLLVSYPVLVHIYSLTLAPLALWLTMGTICLLVGLLMLQNRNRIFCAVSGLVIASVVLIGCNDQGPWLIKMNPVLINLLLAGFFAHTLFGQRLPLITRIAQSMGDEVDTATRHYTRSLTLVWAVFFVLLALESAVLAMWASLEIWSLMTGFVNYIFVGLFFIIEFLVRRRLLPRQTRKGFGYFIFSLARSYYRKLCAN